MRCQHDYVLVFYLGVLLVRAIDTSCDVRWGGLWSSIGIGMFGGGILDIGIRTMVMPCPRCFIP